MNLTAVIMTLLELQTDPMVSIETKKAIAQSGNLPGTGKKPALEATLSMIALGGCSCLQLVPHLPTCLFFSSRV